jgi:carbohydrate ABC transporter substrate-binding protein, CUT1 family (TC 3.A.1.1.-)
MENFLGINGRLFEGDITDEDLVAVLPTGWYDTIHTAELTGKEIRELEQEGFHLCSDYLWIYGRWRCFFSKDT